MADPAEPLELLRAALAGRYRLEREIGAGGMATVYLAGDVKHDRNVAVKVLRPDLAANLGAERFLREIKIAANLQHPHILPVHDSGEAGGFLYYVMPYVDGLSLRQKLQRDGVLPIHEGVRILRDVADAMASAHQHGVVHRDIKPENVMLSGRHALVTDFGVAKAVSQATGTNNLTTAGIALGTPAYMAPEQAMADPLTDHRADIYAFGVLAYEVLTGEPPFSGMSPQAVVAAHITTPAAPVATRRPGIPPALAALVMRCLEKRAADRFQSAEELIPVLEGALTPSGGSTPAGMPPARAMTGTMSRARQLGVAIAIVALVAAVALGWRALSSADSAGAARGGADTREPKSIAVLPLVNVGGDSTQEFFADGMAEELANALGKVPGLRVAARTSSYAFKGRRDLDVREVGEKLNVGAVLEGSVRRVGERIKVSVQLMDAKQRTELWSESYDQAAKDVYAVQDSITRAIVRQLALKLGGAALAASLAGRTSNPEAHDLYLQGQTLVHQGTETSMRRALDYYRMALVKDPNYAQAEQGIAWAYGYLADAYLLPAIAYDSARVAAQRALAHNSLSGDAHMMLGYAWYATEWNLVEADREMRRGYELSPNSVDVRAIGANFLCIVGRIDDGLVQVDQAIALDPLVAIGAMVKEWCLYLGHRYDAVIAQRAKTIAVDANLVYLDSWVGAAYREQGRFDQALAEYAKAQKAAGAQPLYGYAVTYARMGKPKEAREILARLAAFAKRHYVNPIFFAHIYASLGEKDRAFEYLDKAAADRTVLMGGLNGWPELAPLRTDPRFAALVKRVGLPAAR